jgi:Schlafen, AlbA_2
VTLPSLRRLALADLDEPTLRRLVEQGEDLFVERKREPPPAPRFGAQVASFANTLGGWLLLGVDDDRNLIGWEPDRQLDLQSHLGNLLRNEVDPVPPFVAETYSLDGVKIGVVRVFEAADTPVIVRETGAVFVRDPGGKQPIRDHRTLLELARRGEAAREEAQARLGSLPLVQRALDAPELYHSPETAAVKDTGAYPRNRSRRSRNGHAPVQ